MNIHIFERTLLEVSCVGNLTVFITSDVWIVDWAMERRIYRDLVIDTALSIGLLFVTEFDGHNLHINVSFSLPKSSSIPLVITGNNRRTLKGNSSGTLKMNAWLVTRADWVSAPGPLSRSAESELLTLFHLLYETFTLYQRVSNFTE